MAETEQTKTARAEAKKEQQAAKAAAAERDRNELGRAELVTGGAVAVRAIDLNEVAAVRQGDEGVLRRISVVRPARNDAEAERGIAPDGGPEVRDEDHRVIEAHHARNTLTRKENLTYHLVMGPAATGCSRP